MVINQISALVTISQTNRLNGSKKPTYLLSFHFPQLVDVQLLVFDFLERFETQNGKLAQRRLVAPYPLVNHLA